MTAERTIAAAWASCPRGVPFAAVAAVLLLAAEPAAAVQLGGSLSWDLSRTEQNSSFVDTTQESFGQNYRVTASGATVRRTLGNWTAGVGLRRDFTRFSGTDERNRTVTMQDLDLGLSLFPRTLPSTLHFRRSMVDNSSGGPVTQNTLNTTISFNTRVRMGDGNPLGVSAYQSTQDTGSGTATSRLLSLAKRFDLGNRNRLNTAYQFSRFEAPGSHSTGHGASVSDATTWSNRLSSNVYANVSTRTTTTTRLAGGRSLFMNNSAGGNLSYRRDRDVSANLGYAYIENPLTQGTDLRSHQLSGNARVRLDKKTDLHARFTARRLDLGNRTLDTGTMNAGLTYRPRLGWSTGGQVSLSENRTSGIGNSQTTSYSVSGFFNARHQLEPAEINWGGDVSYSSSGGDLSQERLSSNARLEALERRLRWIRISGEVHVTDIRGGEGGGLSPYLREHGIRAVGNVVPLRGVWLPSDVLTGHVTGRINWTNQYQQSRHVRTSDLAVEGRYSPFNRLTTLAAIEVHDHTADEAGADEVLRGNAAWNQPVSLRGSMNLSGDVRRAYVGGDFQSQQLTGRLAYDYSLGLLRVSLSADVTKVELGRGGAGSDSNSVRLNILRTF